MPPPSHAEQRARCWLRAARAAIRRRGIRALGLPWLGLALLAGCLALGPPLRAVERLCQGDATCWAQTAEAPELTYYSVQQALSYGLAHAHEMRTVRYPSYQDVGVAVYPGSEPDTYRVEIVEVGIANHVIIQLGENALAWGHAHPQPDERECSPLENRMVLEYGLPVFIQHADGPLLECRGRGLSRPQTTSAQP